MSSLECVLTTMATLGSDIYLVVILGFSSFNIYHIYLLRFGAIFSNWPNLKVQVISSICLLIFWNICSIDIILLIGLIDKICDIIGSVDTSNFSNLAQFLFFYAFSFGIRFCGGYSICISYIVLTKDCCSLCSSSKSTTSFFLNGFLSLNTFS
jgi:hypothetical protein